MEEENDDLELAVEVVQEGLSLKKQEVKASKESSIQPPSYEDAGEGLKAMAPAAMEEMALDVASDVALFGTLGAKGGISSRGAQSVSRSFSAGSGAGALGQMEKPKPRPIRSQEEYTDYGVNPFVERAQDAQSIIDVDTASYHCSSQTK